MNNKKVSIVIPIFNTENYIEKCVLSLLNQTYKNIEIILIDDGSKDNSYSICKKLAKKYDNIIIAKHEVNQSQAVARNTGISLVTGDYLLFLDSDDTLVDTTVEEMLNKAIDDKVDIVLSSFCRIVNNKKNIEYQNILEEKIYSPSQIASLLFNKIPLNIIFCIGTKLYDMNLINNKNIRFDRQYKFNEDGAFAITAFKNAKSISYIDKPFYQYLLREGESSQISYRKDMYLYLSKTRELIKDYLLEFNLYEDKKIEYLSMQFDIAIASLVNEVRYKKDFDIVYTQILSNPNFKEIMDNLDANKMDFIHKKIFNCFKKDRKNTLKNSLKMNEFLRTIKKVIK